MQVIPTVGVEGDDGDKKRRAIVKHFSRLVDSSAKKAKFLSAFQKKPSSGEELPPSADPSGKAALADAHLAAEAIRVKVETSGQPGSGHLDESRNGAVKQEKDLVLADIKAEAGASEDGRLGESREGAVKQEADPKPADIKAEGGAVEDGRLDESRGGTVKQEADLMPADIKAEGGKPEDEPVRQGAAQAEHAGDTCLLGKSKDTDSEVDISSSDEDVKPEDVQAAKEELAACLQVDSNSDGEPLSLPHLQRWIKPSGSQVMSNNAGCKSS